MIISLAVYKEWKGNVHKLNTCYILTASQSQLLTAINASIIAAV